MKTSPRCDSPRARTIRAIRNWIQDGSLRPGDVIPTEHALCTQFGIARGTVRAALCELERTGLLTRRKGCRRVIAPHARPVSRTFSRTIALISGLEERAGDWQSFPGRLHAIEGSALMAIQREGYHGLTIHPSSLENDGISHICQDRPVGVLMPDPFAAHPAALDAARFFAASDIPVVLNADGDDLKGFDRVVSDHAAGCSALTSRLIERGCRRILRVWTADRHLHWLAQRNKGFEATAAAAGLRILPPVHIVGLPDNRIGREDIFQSRLRLAAGCLIEAFRAREKPDAIMVTCDSETMPVAAACRLLGAVPGDSIIFAGYDNMWQHWPEIQYEPTLPVCTVDKQNAAMGRDMVSLLLQRASGKLAAPPQCIVVAPALIDTTAS